MEESIMSILTEIVRLYGPIGVFLVSFLGNAIPYSTIPYLILIAIYGGAFNVYGQIYVAIIGGLGATLGKIVVLLLGRAARATLSEETKKNLEIFNKISERSMAFAIFIFAALPLPDDVLYVPLGVSGYNMLRFFISALAGKIVITWLTLAFSGAIINATLSYPWWLSLTILLGITLVATYLIIKISWVKVLEAYRDGGIKNGTRYLLKEALDIVFIAPLNRLKVLLARFSKR